MMGRGGVERPGTRMMTRAKSQEAGVEAPRRALGDITNVKGQAAMLKKAAAAAAAAPTLLTVGGGEQAPGQDAVKTPEVMALEDTAAMDLSDLDMDISPPKPGEEEAAVPGAVDDIDQECADDLNMCSEYIADIHTFLKVKERDPDLVCDIEYLQRQKNINGRMRAILIDWMVELHHVLPRHIASSFDLSPFQFCRESLFLTVSLIDRYLSHTQVTRHNLQLVGVACFLLACKYHEVTPPETEEMSFYTNKTYSREQILEMEADILRALKHRITFTTVPCFMSRYLDAAHADEEITQLSWFICEQSLLEENMLPFVPSMIASSAIYLARMNHDYRPWSPTLIHYTQYSEEELMPCLQAMSTWLGQVQNGLNVVHKKYKRVLKNLTLQGVLPQDSDPQT